MDRARQTCQERKAVEVMKVFYEFSKNAMSSNRALDLAIEYSSYENFGKERIARFLIENYRKSVSTQRAVRNSGEALPMLPLGSMNCLQFSYDRYRRSQTNTRALENAIETCR